MKQLACEMCGSADMLKQDGVFVCQHCGMKYSVEEAKKMMIEGTVEVQGTVKVDNSAFVEKYLANARRAMQKEDWEETEKYYNMVEQNAPNNIEAIFYSAYGKARQSLVVNDFFKREAVFKTLDNCVSVLDDNFNVEDVAANNEVMKRIVDDTIRMFGASFVYTKTTDGNGRVSDDTHKTYTLFIQLAAELNNVLDQIARKIPAAQKEDVLFIRKQQLRVTDLLCSSNGHGNDATKTKYAVLSIKLVSIIKAIQPTFKPANDYQQVIDRIETNARIEKNTNIGCTIGAIIIIAAIIIGTIVFITNL